MLTTLHKPQAVTEWIVEWNPTPHDNRNWWSKSYHKTHGDAAADLRAILRSTAYDTDPTHWRISGYHH